MGLSTVGFVSCQGRNKRIKPTEFQRVLVFSVRLIGLEPTQPELPDPKSGASANFATGAGYLADCGCKDSKKFLVSSF